MKAKFAWMSIQIVSCHHDNTSKQVPNQNLLSLLLSENYIFL
jgi:hypothetical protein